MDSSTESEQIYFFGWIPSLSDRLSLEQGVLSLLRDSDKSNLNTHSILLTIKNVTTSNDYKKLPVKELLSESHLSQIRYVMGISPNRDLFCFFQKSNDIAEDEKNLDQAFLYSIATFCLTEDFRIDKIAILDFDPFIKDDRILIPTTIGTVTNIELNGLFTYVVSPTEIQEKQRKIYEKNGKPYAKLDIPMGIHKHLSNIVRDVYHVHIHDRQGDFALFPEKTSIREEAIDGIANQFRSKIPDYLRRLKEIAFPEKGGVAPSKRWNYNMVIEYANRALGETCYGKAFVSRFKMDISRSTEILSALEYFENSVRIIERQVVHLYSTIGTSTGLAAFFLVLFATGKIVFDLLILRQTILSNGEPLSIENWWCSLCWSILGTIIFGCVFKWWLTRQIIP